MTQQSKLPHCETCPSRGTSVFCNLEGEQLKQLDEHKISNKYKKGQTLFFQGNPPFGIFCVNEGKIKISHTGTDGKEAILRIAASGDILGHRSLFSDEHYSATATALEDCTVCFIDKKFILKEIEQCPSVAVNIITQLSKDMGAAEHRIVSMAQKNVRERLAELLLVLKETFGKKVDGRWYLDIKLSREEMASMIGVANETLIRFISELKDEGYIQQEGKTIIITNEEGLMDFANIPH